VVDNARFAAIASALAPVSRGYLRDLLRESGVVLDPAVEGVRQKSFDDLEHSLCVLAEVYRKAREGSDRIRMRECRTAVIEAKDHARWAARRSKEAAKRLEKEEMARWMLVWLENPEIFPAWARLRRQALS